MKLIFGVMVDVVGFPFGFELQRQQTADGLNWNWFEIPLRTAHHRRHWFFSTWLSLWKTFKLSLKKLAKTLKELMKTLGKSSEEILPIQGKSYFHSYIFTFVDGLYCFDSLTGTPDYRRLIMKKKIPYSQRSECQRDFTADCLLGLCIRILIS